MRIVIVDDDGTETEAAFYCMACGLKECACRLEKYKLLPLLKEVMGYSCHAHLIDKIAADAPHAYRRQVVVQDTPRMSVRCDYCQANATYQVSYVMPPPEEEQQSS